MSAREPLATALVLCGGASRRMGSDKLAAPFGTTTVLDALLDALPAAWPVVAVGPLRPTRRAVQWAREDPPGGGPVAGVAAGLRLVHTELLVVVAGDLPFAGPWVDRVADLLAATETEAMVAVDRNGRTNPLLAAYRTERLRAVLPSAPQGRAARDLLTAVEHGLVLVPDEAALDVDTPEALTAARSRLAT